MAKKKFILLSILKTWLISTVISIVLLIVFMILTREPVREHPRNCDMSGLAYAFVIFWIFFLSILSFSSLFSLLKLFHGKVKGTLCWFLFPVISSVFYYCTVADGKTNRDDIALFLIIYLPWFVLWIFYYSRLDSRSK